MIDLYSPYLDHPTDDTQRHVIEDLRSQVNALRMQINSQPNPVQSYHPMATYSPTQTQPLPQQYPTGFDFKGGMKNTCKYKIYQKMLPS